MSKSNVFLILIKNLIIILLYYTIQNITVFDLIK